MRKRMYWVFSIVLDPGVWAPYVEDSVMGTESGVDCRCALLETLPVQDQIAQASVNRVLLSSMSEDASWRVRLQAAASSAALRGGTSQHASLASMLLTRLFDEQAVAFEAIQVIWSRFGGLCGVALAALRTLPASAAKQLESADSAPLSQVLAGVLLACIDARNKRLPGERHVIRGLESLRESLLLGWPLVPSIHAAQSGTRPFTALLGVPTGGVLALPWGRSSSTWSWRARTLEPWP